MIAYIRLLVFGLAAWIVACGSSSGDALTQVSTNGAGGQAPDGTGGGSAEAGGQGAAGSFGAGGSNGGGTGGAATGGSSGSGATGGSPSGRAGGGSTSDGGGAPLTCPAGAKPCNGTCVAAETSVGCAIGHDDCSPCPAPDHAFAICAAGQCDFECLIGYSRAGTVCEVDPTCAAGEKVCAGSCEEPTAENGCDSAACTPCPFPLNSVPICLNGQCDFECVTGFVRNGSECVPQACDAAMCPACPNALPCCTAAGTCGCRFAWMPTCG